MNKGLTRITDSLASGKWAITPSAYSTLCNNIDKIIANPSNSTLSEEAKEWNPDPNLVGSNEETGLVGLINVCGTLSKNPSEMEQIFLGCLDIDFVSNALDQMAGDTSIEYIVLCFASPGGEVVGIPELGRKIANIDANIKPVYAWTETQMSSGAYWLGSQTRGIGMTPSSTVGCIGVYTLILDETKAMEESGLSIVPFSSGIYKLIGASFHTLTEDEKKILQDGVNKDHDAFKKTILAKRSDVPDEAMQGLSYEGEEAVKYNLADSLHDSLNEFLNNIPNMNIKKVKPNTNSEAISQVPKSGEVPKTEKTLAEAAKEAMGLAPTVPAANATETKPDAKAEVPGVPGTEGSGEESDDPYEGQYATANDDGSYCCPACAASFKIKSNEDDDQDDDEEDDEKKAEATIPPVAVNELNHANWLSGCGIVSMAASENPFQRAVRETTHRLF